MLLQKLEREAPAAVPLDAPKEDPSFPNVGDPSKPKEFEEVLQIEEIQGNAIPGFNKDFQTTLILEIIEAGNFKLWLQSVAPLMATTAEVLAFNRLFKAIRCRRGEPTGVKATWVNIAFSHDGIKKLAEGTDLLNTDFIDQAFTGGMAERAQEVLGDPTGDIEGNPEHWRLGGPKNDPADVILLVASDDRLDMFDQVSRIEQSLYELRDGAGKPISSGARVVFKEEGANLPGDLHGHEQFKTLDGISQPGLRGRVSDNPHDVLTSRQNPFDRGQGKPGQDLLWPGSFVFGYPGQNKDADSLDDSKGDPTQAGPDWAKNGSYLVFRRLRQDVFKFHSFLNSQGGALLISPREVSAKLVGRWLSGAPVVRTPDADIGAMGNNDCANNNFEFNDGGPKLRGAPGRVDCDDKFPGSPTNDAIPPSAEASGERCPFDAHTRKAYPRNDLTPGGLQDASGTPITSRDKQIARSEATTQTHRMLRRGIPYGDVSLSTPDVPTGEPAFVDRGLHFFSYQTSIVDQFEFVTQNWVNNKDFSTEAAAGHGCPLGGGNVLPVGSDPVIGQNNGPNGDRTRKFFIRFKDAAKNDQCRELTAPDDWVFPTGGGYFFAPSISALFKLAGAVPPSRKDGH